MAENFEITAALANELAAQGLRDVCLSPGGRSTPLALTFARHPGIRHWIHHDERSAAFFALGIAKETGRPVAVITTSGTAAAELHPAVVEANYGQTGLILLTADRPPEMRGTGANQTIDQVELFGTAVKWFHDAPLPSTTTVARTQALAARAWTSASATPPGPVHINLPFAEPLTPTNSIPELGVQQAAASWTTTATNPDEESLRNLAAALEGKCGLIVAGPGNDRLRAAPAIADLARALDWPVLADPLSGLRTGSHDLSQILATGDALARAGFLNRVTPEVLVRLGAVPTSKAINSWIS
ncbi:MAG: 2-succinyl-5-enolpyruvyl-6-hydroxy-3-cyclohexene-1-carboxylic-acid synthase, partial [Dehalococcoidia bacterium]